MSETPRKYDESLRLTLIAGCGMPPSRKDYNGGMFAVEPISWAFERDKSEWKSQCRQLLYPLFPKYLWAGRHHKKKAQRKYIDAIINQHYNWCILTMHERRKKDGSIRKEQGSPQGFEETEVVVAQAPHAVRIVHRPAAWLRRRQGRALARAALGRSDAEGPSWAQGHAVEAELHDGTPEEEEGA